MQSNIIFPSPKDSIAPSDNIEKGSGNLDDAESPKGSVAPGNTLEKSREDMDDKLSPKYSVASSDKIEITKEYFVARSVEKDKKCSKYHL